MFETTKETRPRRNSNAVRSGCNTMEHHGTTFDPLRVEAALSRVAAEVEEMTFRCRSWCLAPLSINLDPASTD